MCSTCCTFSFIWRAVSECCEDTDAICNQWWNRIWMMKAQWNRHQNKSVIACHWRINTCNTCVVGAGRARTQCNHIVLFIAASTLYILCALYVSVLFVHTNCIHFDFSKSNTLTYDYSKFHLMPFPLFLGTFYRRQWWHTRFSTTIYWKNMWFIRAAGIPYIFSRKLLPRQRTYVEILLLHILLHF